MRLRRQFFIGGEQQAQGVTIPFADLRNNPSISHKLRAGRQLHVSAGHGRKSRLARGGHMHRLDQLYADRTAGSISGTLVFTDNSLSARNNGMQSIPLSGTAPAPVVATPSYRLYDARSKSGGQAIFTPVTGSGRYGHAELRCLSRPRCRRVRLTRHQPARSPALLGGSEICWALVENTAVTKLKSSTGYRKPHLKLFFP
jgi:hypothetical protein